MRYVLYHKRMGTGALSHAQIEWRKKWVESPYERVMSHSWMRQVLCYKGTGTVVLCMSHVIYEWVVSHMNESCHIWMSHVTYEWVMSHMNESCVERNMSHIRANESCHIYEWVMPHTWMGQVLYHKGTGTVVELVRHSKGWFQCRDCKWQVCCSVLQCAAVSCSVL